MAFYKAKIVYNSMLSYILTKEESTIHQPQAGPLSPERASFYKLSLVIFSILRFHKAEEMQHIHLYSFRFT